MDNSDGLSFIVSENWIPINMPGIYVVIHGMAFEVWEFCENFCETKNYFGIVKPMAQW